MPDNALYIAFVVPYRRIKIAANTPGANSDTGFVLRRGISGNYRSVTEINGILFHQNTRYEKLCTEVRISSTTTQF